MTGALGLSPSPGTIHQGATRAFLYDLAGVYKTTVSIPAAFEAAEFTKPGGARRSPVRRRLHEQRVLPAMLRLAQGPSGKLVDAEDATDQLLDDQGFVPGLIDWSLA